MNTRAAVIAIIAGIVSGALIGGLIGHLITKSKNAGTSKHANMADPARDKKHQQMILDNADTTRLRDVLRELTEKPHLAASEENNRLGEMIKQRWSSYGMKTFDDRYDVLLSFPGGEGERNKAQVLGVGDTVIYTSQEVEKVLDPDQNGTEVVPPFNAYAKAGTVTSAQVYYVNYCRLEDFKEMTDLSFDFQDSIIVCRYGKIFRGNKVALAQQHGARGVIMYNDPLDYVDTNRTTADYDGTFPNSMFLPPSGAQRGSVYTQSGDPLTRGYPATDYAFRLTVEEVRAKKYIPNIPTQPMGYEDAEQFLKELEGIGAEVPEAWRGGMPIKYHYGGTLPDNKQFKIINNNREVRKNITNVFGVIEGAEEPDRYVLVGNHRDAWMFGATDPSSGTTIMMEVSRLIHLLMESGWKPRRTIVFCSWGGEEYGIIGSIEWLESVKTMMDARALTYLNCDSGVMMAQLLTIGASPLTYQLIYDTARLVSYPDRDGQTLYDGWLVDRPGHDNKPKIYDLGSGTDHTGFYHTLGIPAIDMGFHGDRSKMKISDWYPTYHTTYDTFDLVDKYTDPGFIYHKALTQLLAELTRALSSAVIIPFRTIDYATRLETAVQNLDNRIRSDVGLSRQHFLDNLMRAVQRFKVKATGFDNMAANVDTNSWSEVRRINDQLMLLERSFLYPLGILDRKYIRHVVFAPSATDSYSSVQFPGVMDSLFEYKKNASRENELRLEEELTKAIYVVESAAKSLGQVTDIV